MGGHKRSVAVAIRTARQYPSLVLGAAVVLAIVAVAVLAPLIAPRDPLFMDASARLQLPSADHVLGTDNFGRDLLSRLMHGARVSLIVGLSAVGLAIAGGTALGLASGYLEGWGDLILMRIVDVLLAFPPLLLALSLVSVLGTGVSSVIVAVAVVQSTTYARVVRATVLALNREDFILAARAQGVPGLRIALRHLLPNSLAPVLVLATVGIGTAITTEAALSFLGLGVPPPTPSWGATLAFGLAYLRDSPHLAIFPGIAIIITVLGFNLLGDGLRDITDPRLRRG
ncbi:MAG: ABC transporter permease [Candidatus Limnocylindria bacterium]